MVRRINRHPTALSLKNRLRALRAEHAISQAELAQRVGVSRQTINALEVEKYDPSLALAHKLACVFGFRIDQVFALDELG